MKIGIISMQRIINNGSFLQAYGLYMTLKEMGHEVEFIDFENELASRVMDKRGESVVKNVLRSIKHFFIKKYRDIKKTRAISIKFKESFTQYFPIIGLNESLNCPQGKSFDLVIVGSDESFNVCQFSENNASIPWTLIGEGIETKKIISYAASCAQTDLLSLKKYEIYDRMQSNLKKFATVSVRDQKTAKVVEALTGQKTIEHVDPVLLYNTFPQDSNYKKLPYPYILIYAYTLRISNEDEIRAIKAFAKIKKMKLVCVNCFQSWGEQQIITSPFALLQYVQDASYVITDTFHGTIFSIKQNIKFATIVRESNTNKLTCLLEKFGLEDRIVPSMLHLNDILELDIDYDKINSVIKEEQLKSTQYLQQHSEQTA